MNQLTGKDVNLQLTWDISQGKQKLELGQDAKQRMNKSLNYIRSRIEAGETMYGVNTGFGALSGIRISNEDIKQLQRNIIRSHCAGVGPKFSQSETRAIMYLRANALATGMSGIRPQVVEKILEFMNADIIPVIPQQGSVGASGDLAPLSHLALALIGEGEVWSGDQIVPVSKVLNSKNILPLELEAKEGLSLINGCQVMTAVGLLNAYRSKRVLKLLDVAGAISLEALKGSRKAFDPVIAPTRAHPGEGKTARNLLHILGETSQISESHANCGRVQDAYSLRCMPAVHGAAKDTLKRTIEILETEANSSTDNPLVFADENKILSCGNFHGEPVAFQMDFLGIAMAAAGNISECRIEKMINPAMSNGLPPFLAVNAGLNSGMMMVEVAAASLVSENKILAHPASVDSIPTSADKEDHVSMGTIAARKLGSIIQNVENVLAMELLCGTQALDLLLPLKSGEKISSIHQFIRQSVPFAKEDRIFSKDIEKILGLIQSDALMQKILEITGELEC